MRRGFYVNLKKNFKINPFSNKDTQNKEYADYLSHMAMWNKWIDVQFLYRLKLVVNAVGVITANTPCSKQTKLSKESFQHQRFFRLLKAIISPLVAFPVVTESTSRKPKTSLILLSILRSSDIFLPSLFCFKY